MFRIEYRFTGFGVWNATAGLATAQGAWGQARGMDMPLRADEVRVVPSGAPVPRFDLKV
ncbi:hypothetical protein [Phenylobacterium sp.]|jgi:hypothetical protein|uniref:hypothetical protein n=1 Tax=Phenylobacterium sp. TaxID=1871053 RepID=UPI002F3FFC2E